MSQDFLCKRDKVHVPSRKNSWRSRLLKKIEARQSHVSRFHLESRLNEFKSPPVRTSWEPLLCAQITLHPCFSIADMGARSTGHNLCLSAVNDWINYIYYWINYSFAFPFEELVVRWIMLGNQLWFYINIYKKKLYDISWVHLFCFQVRMVGT